MPPTSGAAAHTGRPAEQSTGAFETASNPPDAGDSRRFPTLDGSNIALVTVTRDYDPGPLLSGLASHGFTSIERRYDASIPSLLQRFVPGLVVAVVDPRALFDVGIIRFLSEQVDAVLLVVTPDHSSFSEALSLGADACLADDDSPSMYTAQIGSMRRRIPASPLTPLEEFTVGDIVVDRRARSMRIGRNEVRLTPTEFEIIENLSANAGRVLMSSTILRLVSGIDVTQANAAAKVKVYIRRLRRKIEILGGDSRIIVSVRGLGYMIDDKPPAKEEAPTDPSLDAPRLLPC